MSEWDEQQTQWTNTQTDRGVELTFFHWSTVFPSALYSNPLLLLSVWDFTMGQEYFCPSSSPPSLLCGSEPDVWNVTNVINHNWSLLSGEMTPLQKLQPVTEAFSERHSQPHCSDSDYSGAKTTTLSGWHHHFSPDISVKYIKEQFRERVEGWSRCGYFFSCGI